MGRKKVEIKRIEDKSSRQVTFSKRRNGLIKKAKELSILCDVDIAVVIFSSRGKLYDFSSSKRLAEILQRYQSHVKVEKNMAEGAREEEEHRPRYASFLTIQNLLETVERTLEEANVDKLQVMDLVDLEEQLETALMQTRCKKTCLMMDCVKRLHEELAALTNNNTADVSSGNLAHAQMICGQQPATLDLL